VSETKTQETPYSNSIGYVKTKVKKNILPRNIKKKRKYNEIYIL